MQRKFRLTRSTDFKRVRRFGKSYAHPLVVLIVQPSEGSNLRVGVTAGKTVGFAVQRNRAKRLLRAAMQTLLADLAPGADLLLIARQPLTQSNLEQTRAAVQSVLRRARLLPAPDDR
ncbi:MAG: ribonuclease P protein component [Chloroflexi bacterium]|nr:ribonuclease P protein component [Chloroflexota bacterium]